MDLNVQTWKEFEIERLFSIKRGDRIVKDEDYFDIAPSDDYKYRVITASATNNGVDGVYNDFNCDGNCLISCGEANGMFTTWQNEPCWVLDTARIYTPKGFTINEITGMFLATLLSANMYRFSYGRKAKPDNMYSLGLKLPIQHNPDGTPAVDADKTYSDEGYIPDWQFMEDYIKSLHSEPITTTRGAVESLSLGVDKWEEFKLSDIFEMQNGYFNNKPETIDSLPSDHPVKFLGATAENNGITDYCGIEAIRYSSKTGDSDNSLDGKIYEGNCITITNDGSVCHAYYQDTPFTSSHSQTICVPKFELNPALALFICAIIDGEQFKWSYGRKLHDLNKSKAIVIKLPIQRDASGNPVIDPDKKYSDKGYIPDWDFMERYIDSLPYSDKIA